MISEPTNSTHSPRAGRHCGTAWLITVALTGALMLHTEPALAAALGPPMVATPNAPSACNENDSLANAALNARKRGDLTSAQADIDAILRKNKDDFRGNYTSALILLDQSRIDYRPTGYDKTKVLAGLKLLEHTTTLLEAMSGACLQTAKALGWGSIYNTLGVYYFNSGDTTNAARVWLLGYRSKRPLMNAKTQERLLNNLGLLYREDHLNQPALSGRYYSEALALQRQTNPAALAKPTRLQSLIPKF